MSVSRMIFLVFDVGKQYFVVLGHVKWFTIFQLSTQKVYQGTQQFLLFRPNVGRFGILLAVNFSEIDIILRIQKKKPEITTFLGHDACQPDIGKLSCEAFVAYRYLGSRIIIELGYSGLSDA